MDEEEIEQLIERKVEEKLEEKQQEKEKSNQNLIDQKIDREIQQQKEDGENPGLDRRSFLKTLGVAAGGLALTSSTTAWSIIQPLTDGKSEIDADTVDGQEASELGGGARPVRSLAGDVYIKNTITRSSNISLSLPVTTFTKERTGNTYLYEAVTSGETPVTTKTTINRTGGSSAFLEVYATAYVNGYQNVFVSGTIYGSGNTLQSFATVDSVNNTATFTTTGKATQSYDQFTFRGKIRGTQFNNRFYRIDLFARGDVYYTSETSTTTNATFQTTLTNTLNAPALPDWTYSGFGQTPDNSNLSVNSSSLPRSGYSAFSSGDVLTQKLYFSPLTTTTTGNMTVSPKSVY